MAISIGVPDWSRSEDNRLWNGLTMPFRRQRKYRHRPDGSAVERPPDASRGKATHLAE